jgi:hypothetical protein
MAPQAGITRGIRIPRVAWALGGVALLAALMVGLGIARHAGEGTVAGRAPNVAATAVATPGGVAQAVPGALGEAATDAEGGAYHVYLTDSGQLAAWAQQHYAELNAQRAAAGLRPLGVEVHIIRSADEDVRIQEQLASAAMASRFAEAPELKVVDLRAP